MCFSATASFVAGGILVGAGIYSVRHAIADKRFLPYASIPLIFGIQQGIEGLVWNRIAAQDPVAIHVLSILYLFFAYGFWPFFIPFCIGLIERDPVHKKILNGLMYLGLLWGGGAYAVVLLNTHLLSTSVIHHSIVYTLNFTDLPTLIYTLGYILIVTGAFFLSTATRIKLFGVLLLLSVFISVALFYYAFCSVWCFFAAGLSLFICLKPKGTSHVPKQLA